MWKTVSPFPISSFLFSPLHLGLKNIILPSDRKKSFPPVSFDLRIRIVHNYSFTASEFEYFIKNLTSSKLPFLPVARETIAFLISKWRTENKSVYLSFHFYLSEKHTRVLARPIKKRYLYFLPHCWISLFHAYSSRARNWIFLGALAEALSGKKRDKTFFPWWKNAHRLYYALMQDPCTQSFSRWIRNFHTCPDLARRSTVSSDFLLFSSIYILYIYYIPVMKIFCDVSGDAAVSSRTGMITGQIRCLVSLTRMWKRERGHSRGREREGKGRDERHLSISFNPTFPCRLLLSIYYKLFCRSPRGAACPADGENTRAFHSIKFDKVRRRCTEVPEGVSRYRESKMARVSSISGSRIDDTALETETAFQNLSIVHRVPLFYP